MTRTRPTVLSSFLPARLEPLELRRLLNAQLQGDLLDIEGTAGNDVITVERVGENFRQIEVIINGDAQRFNAADVKRIFIDGLGGNDNIRAAEGTRILKKRLGIQGGGGNDNITGSARNDNIDGGSGNDSVGGADGRDTLKGSKGDDTLEGAGGEDFLLGGRGSDLLNGNGDDDQAYGDYGSDTVNGNSGNDILGGGGEDRLLFEGQSAPAEDTGDDVLNGGAGNDWLLGGLNTPGGAGGVEDEDGPGYDLDDNGQDTLTGGPGSDILDARGGDDSIMDESAGDLVPFERYQNSLTATEETIHQHVILTVFVDGTKLSFPVGLGQFAGRAVVHKHNGDTNDDRVHLHDVEQGVVFRLIDIFQAFGISFSNTHIGRFRAGKNHELIVRRRESGSGDEFTTIANPVNYVIDAPDDGTEPHDEIEIRFT